MDSCAVTGGDHVAIGSLAARNITCGLCNVAIGHAAGCWMTAGRYNISIGAAAGCGACCLEGNCNTLIGKLTGAGICGDAVGNTVVGSLAAGSCYFSGCCNTVIGTYSGIFLRTGNYNTSIGTSTHLLLDIATLSNTFVLGSDVSCCYVAKVAWSTSSDCRDKTDIESFTTGLDFIKALRPVTYKWDSRSSYWEKDEDGNLVKNNSVVPDGTHKQQKTYLGLIAQEVLPLEQSLGYNTSGSGNDQIFVGGGPLPVDNPEEVDDSNRENAYTMGYEKFIMPLINAVKELDAENTALKSRVTTLEGG